MIKWVVTNILKIYEFVRFWVQITIQNIYNYFNFSKKAQSNTQDNLHADDEKVQNLVGDIQQSPSISTDIEDTTLDSEDDLRNLIFQNQGLEQIKAMIDKNPMLLQLAFDSLASHINQVSKSIFFRINLLDYLIAKTTEENITVDYIQLLNDLSKGYIYESHRFPLVKRVLREVENKELDTALGNAIEARYLKIIKLFIDADVNITELHLIKAAEIKDADIFALLVNKIVEKSGSISLTNVACTELITPKILSNCDLSKIRGLPWNSQASNCTEEDEKQPDIITKDLRKVTRGYDIAMLWSYRLIGMRSCSNINNIQELQIFDKLMQEFKIPNIEIYKALAFDNLSIELRNERSKIGSRYAFLIFKRLISEEDIDIHQISLNDMIVKRFHEIFRYLINKDIKITLLNLKLATNYKRKYKNFQVEDHISTGEENPWFFAYMIDKLFQNNNIPVDLSNLEQYEPSESVYIAGTLTPILLEFTDLAKVTGIPNHILENARKLQAIPATKVLDSILENIPLSPPTTIIQKIALYLSPEDISTVALTSKKAYQQHCM